MANRPGTLCNLKSGKSIGAQSNFSDTFNWLVSCLDNLKAGRGIVVKWPSSDTPEISIDDSAFGDNGGSSEGGGGTTDAVYDVSDSYNSSTGKQSLTISYTDDRSDKTIELKGGGSGDVKFNGTDATQASGNEFTFASASDSNVTVNCDNGVITIGVYYL